jgi:transcriptional activator for dhaKLM operon
MRPNDYPYAPSRISEIWRLFQAGGVLDAATFAELDPVVYESWRRCHEYLHVRLTSIVPQARQPKLEQLLDRNHNLITVALPYLEDIHQLTEGSNSVVLLGDDAARLIAIEGDPSVINLINRLGLNVGSSWTETSIGTNALGLTLVTAMPVQVVGAEHYFQIYHPFASTAAPIHDDKGQIIGTVGLTTPVEAATPHHLAVVMATARAIGNQLQTDVFLEQANEHLLKVVTILEAVTEGIMMWDTAGIISHINGMAAQLVGASPAGLLGHSLTQLIEFPQDIHEAIVEHQALSNVETTFRFQERTIPCLLTIRPIRMGEVGITGSVAILRPIQQVRRLVNQQIGTQAALTFDNLKAYSVEMRKVLRQAQVAARGSSSVLLSGESGVGKNAIARAIHNASPRADKPFIVINCQAIPRELILSELLGHEGDKDNPGQPSKFELVDGGTLLFDQIDHLSLEAQAILQQVINTRQIVRLGGARTILVNVRILATTSTDIDTLVTNRSFSAELYYRFRVFHLAIPPLRQRVEDIPLLVEYYLSHLAERQEQKPGLAMDAEALETLCRYPWPGNVNELESVLERAIIDSNDDAIRVTDLPQNIRLRYVIPGNALVPQQVVTLAEAEREAVIRAGYACQGVVSKMAAVLGIDRTTLWRKMKQLNLSPEQFKSF